MLSPSFSLPAIWYMASRKHSHVISYVPTTDRFPCGIGKRNPKIVGLFYQLTAKPKAFRAVLTTDGPCVYFHFCMMCAFRNNSSVMTIKTIFNRKLRQPFLFETNLFCTLIQNSEVMKCQVSLLAQ